MKMVAATNNNHKLEELRSILKDIHIELLSLSEVGLDVDVEENGSTFIENALIKAREICRLTEQPALADDSGLEVFALNNEPGIRSARYSGVEGADKDARNREKLIQSLENVPEHGRGARFCCAIAAVFPDGREAVAEGFVYGSIGFEEKGSQGFGYDSLFIVDGLGVTMAEIDSDTKNKISHRANALTSFLEKVKDIM